MRLPKSEEGFVPIVVLVVVLVAAGLLASTTIQTTKNYATKASQSVLGDNISEADQKAQEDAQHAQEQAQEQQKHQQEQSWEQSNQSPQPNSTPQINFQSQGAKQEMEIQTPDGLHIHYKVEDNGAVKIEGEQGQLHFKFASESGQIKTAVENELEHEGIKIASQEGQPMITKNNVAAVSNFPISFDTSANQLMVTTPTGQKILTTLPDQAVNNLLAAKTITQINQSASGSAQLSSAPSVKIATRDNQLVYQIEGNKTYKVFGVIPVTTPVTAFVSADSGNVIAQNQPIIANLLSLLSPK